ncbi:MAG: shikimate dehydrogenase [Bacteroidia bacterium]|nr:shikimate dehydrogenase [Bacteroidia bacterium]NND52241.1 shikimate dehydrogenase [Flavobacteriaceae bacterium]
MDNELEKSRYKYGLVGKDIDYSFSKSYFKSKFENENLHCSYKNFDLQNIEEFPSILSTEIKGLNVTIPYKEQIIPYLDKLSKKAEAIGAVNTIKISKKGKLKGYNTDAYGFKKSLKPLLKKHHQKALILGTGGASKAIIFVLNKLGISYSFVSRVLNEDVNYSYDTLTDYDIEQHQIIINCTPLGTFPKVEEFPKIPYDGISGSHLLYDLVYNPPISKFLEKGLERGATVCNGENMLALQAEKSWKIWNS